MRERILISASTLIQGSREFLLSPPIQSIKNYLTIPNPAYLKSIHLNLPFTPPKTLNYYELSSKELCIPVGATNYALTVLGKDVEVCDLRNEAPLDIPYSPELHLRNYQIEALNAVKDRTIGIISAPTGSGKTYIILKLIQEKAQRTLILVNTIELQNQFVKRLLELTSLTAVGTLGGGKYDFYPITVGTLQTVRNIDVGSYFGMTIFDEVHICAANTYYAAMHKINTKYKFGFSATPERTDGLTRVIFFATGPIVHTVPINKAGQYLLQPTFEIVRSNFTWPIVKSTDYIYAMSDLSINYDRNKLILDHYNSNPAHKNMHTIILCSLRTQVYALWKIFGKTGGVLISNIDANGHAKLKKELKLSDDEIKEFSYFGKKEPRKQTIQNINEGKINIIFTTYGLFSTGIDISSLELLYMAAPTKSKIRILQSKGRIMREKAQKHPKIVHIFDDKIEMFRRQGKQLHKIIQESLET